MALRMDADMPMANISQKRIVHFSPRLFKHATVWWLLACWCWVYSTALYAQQTVLVLGDSLSAAYAMPEEKGWVYLLDQALADVNVINASITGETTSGGRQRLPGLLKKHQPDVVIIELGGNDGLRGLPIMSIHDNLEMMITKSLETGTQVILIGMSLPPNYSKGYIKAFNNIYQQLHEKYQLPFIPFFLEDVALNKGLMMKDGIHPNSKAQPVLKDRVIGILNDVLTAEKKPQEISS